MQARYNLRLTKKQPISSGIQKISKGRRGRPPRRIPTELSSSPIPHDQQPSDDLQQIIARHERRRLEEQKDRRLYERYVREQHALCRLQSRRTHAAHLNEKTRHRLLKQLERERRFLIHDQICTNLRQHHIVFQRCLDLQSATSIAWPSLEKELRQTRMRTLPRLHQLDVSINHLKKLTQTSKSSRSKGRLSVRERQKQRLISNTTPIKYPAAIPLPTSLPFVSYSPRVTLVRCIDPHQLPKRLTSIQNVLSYDNGNSSNELRSMDLRKSVKRKRLSEKENRTNSSLVSSSSNKSH